MLTPAKADFQPETIGARRKGGERVTCLRDCQRRQALINQALLSCRKRPSACAAERPDRN